jgi:hypothetical protein
MKPLTPFQAQRVLLIGKLRELVINGHSPLAIQAELGIRRRYSYLDKKERERKK